jgi:hypothetical protein
VEVPAVEVHSSRVRATFLWLLLVAAAVLSIATTTETELQVVLDLQLKTVEMAWPFHQTQLLDELVVQTETADHHSSVVAVAVSSETELQITIKADSASPMVDKVAHKVADMVVEVAPSADAAAVLVQVEDTPVDQEAKATLLQVAEVVLMPSVLWTLLKLECVQATDSSSYLSIKSLNAMPVVPTLLLVTSTVKQMLMTTLAPTLTVASILQLATMMKTQPVTMVLVPILGATMQQLVTTILTQHVTMAHASLL